MKRKQEAEEAAKVRHLKVEINHHTPQCQCINCWSVVYLYTKADPRA